MLDNKEYNVIWTEKHSIVVIAEDDGEAIRKAMDGSWSSRDIEMTEQPRASVVEEIEPPETTFS